ncbi:MAG: hypothetical protein IJF83_04820 [Methanobrevibacter sp.]|nr:hypothetical protein [Methanobrevibacter sp.]MBQ6628831.1 hypothetical protein [Methanobrevibacter sp.]
MIKILLIILCCYAFISVVMSFIFIVLNWKEFSERFDENERATAIILFVTLGPILLIAAFFTILTKPLLRITVWRDKTKTVTEETVSTSLSKVLKNYNKYFEKN